jgi:hypothetical protein
LLPLGEEGESERVSEAAKEPLFFAGYIYIAKNLYYKIKSGNFKLFF